jgi:UDP-N-acetylmuramate dehydrogenase
MAATTENALLSRLPAVRGKLRGDAELAKTNWFGVGGRAEVLFRPLDETDLAFFLREKPADVAVTVLGVGSNLIVRDGGLDGVVVKLGGSFAHCEVEGDLLHCGAGALDVHVAQQAQQHGLAGLEFLSGIPGTIGGALRMNAGAYGREIRDVLVQARAIDPQGNLHVLERGAMDFDYRRCNGVPEDWVFVGCTLRGRAGDKEAIAAEMQRIAEARGDSQPVKSRTGGSTFKNPTGHKAWQLVDEAGCRGLRMGGAQVSELHCNFLINTGDATARDLEALGEEVRKRVQATSGISLEWEIKRIGKEA